MIPPPPLWQPGKKYALVNWVKRNVNGKLNLFILLKIYHKSKSKIPSPEVEDQKSKSKFSVPFSGTWYQDISGYILKRVSCLGVPFGVPFVFNVTRYQDISGYILKHVSWLGVLFGVPFVFNETRNQDIFLNMYHD